MKKFKFLFICFSLVMLVFSCSSSEVEGISDENVAQNSMNSGWEFEDFACQLDYNTANPLAVLLPSLKEALEENVHKRLYNGVLYFRDTVVYYAQKDDNADLVYYRGSHYNLYQNPTRIELSHATLLSGAYIPNMYIKKAGDRLCLYLTREETLALIREDGSIEDKYVEIIEKNIDDAQFEFYLKRVEYPFFDLFE